MNISNLNINISDLLKNDSRYRTWGLLLLLLLPLTSLVQEYRAFSLINRLLTAVFILLMTVYFYRRNTKKDAVLYFAVFASVLLSICVKIAKGNYREIVTPFHFLFAYFLLRFCARETQGILEDWKKHRRFIDLIILLWVAAVLVSFFLPSSWDTVGRTWGSDKYFFSFTKSGGARLGTIALLMLVIIEFQWLFYKDKQYIFMAVVPLLAVFFSGNRTGMLMCIASLLCIGLSKIKSKKRFVVICIVLVSVLCVILWLSPFGRKSRAALHNGSVLTDYLPAINYINLLTNHRVDFIINGFKEYSHSPLINRLIGSSPVTEECLDDVTTVLRHFGIFGLAVYLKYIFDWLKSLKSSGSTVLPRIMLYGCLLTAFLAQTFFTFINQTIAICFMGIMLTLLKEDQNKL